MRETANPKDAANPMAEAAPPPSADAPPREPWWRMAGVLAFTSALAAGILAFAAAFTKEAREEREKEAKANALAAIFWQHMDDQGRLSMHVTPLEGEGQAAGDLYALHRYTDDAKTVHEAVPAYYAAVGAGMGYNTSVPIKVMAGFANPAHPAGAAELLRGYVPDDGPPAPAGEPGWLLVGFTVVKSEETPGLGEQIRDQAPSNTWAGRLSGRAPTSNPDKATDFQKKFRGERPDALRVAGGRIHGLAPGKNTDVITSATLTVKGLVDALRDAQDRLASFLPPASASGPSGRTH